MAKRVKTKERSRWKQPSGAKPRAKKQSALPSRLQKVLASAGVGSRRDCEALILEGRVEIDRKVVTELGVRVDPDEQEIRLDGDILRPEKIIYYAVHKPTGVLSTNRDPAGRMRVVDLVPPDTRLFTVGRLDKASEGLMLVTNDGDLANRLAHPRYNVEKVYLVTVVGHPSPESLSKLRRGVHLADGIVRAKRLRIKARKQRTAILEMVLTEGRNREIRRMAAAIGHKVTSLRRIAIGPLRLGDMPPGAYRPLTVQELKKLKSLVRRGPRQSVSSSRVTKKKRPIARAAKPSSRGAAKRDGTTKKTAKRKVATGTGAKGKATKGKATKGKVTKGKVTKGKVTKGKVTKGKVTKGKVTKGKVTKGKVTKGKVTKGKVTKGKVTKGKVTKGKVTKGKVMKGKVTKKKRSGRPIKPSGSGGSPSVRKGRVQKRGKGR